jgi:hypothetical protein
MIAASAVGIFLIPPLYVVFQWLREKVRGEAAAGPRSEVAEQPRAETATPPRGEASPASV